MKVCTTCRTAKPLTEYGVNRQGKFGRRARCKACTDINNAARYRRDPAGHLARQKRNREADPTAFAARRRDQKFRRKYGLTAKERDSMAGAQGGACLICETVRPLKVDHCHATGAVRGLLCGLCNTALGAFQDNPALLDRAAAYLREHGR